MSSAWRLFIPNNKTIHNSATNLVKFAPTGTKNLNCAERSEMSRKEILSLRKLSTIFEWKEDDPAARQTNARQSETDLRRSMTVNERKDSRIYDHNKGIESEHKNHAKFPEIQRAATSGFSIKSPLKGIPWDQAGFRSVSSSLSYSSSQWRDQGTGLRQRRSAKEQECIDLWLKFFG